MSGWLSIVEYARHHDVSDMTVRRRIKTGRLKAELRDGKYYIYAGNTKDTSASDRIQTHTEAISSEPDKPLATSTRGSRQFDDGKDPEPPISSPPPYSPQTAAHESNFRPRPSAERGVVARSNLDPNKLLEFCESVLAKSAEREDILKQSFKYESRSLTDRIDKLGSELKLKEKTIEDLKNENEDLKLLIKILEGKSA